MSQQEAAGAAGATIFKAEAQVPLFSKDGGYAQEGARLSGATSGANIETNAPLTSTGREGLEAQERQGARGGIYTDEIQITNFTFMPAKNMMENLGLSGLEYGAGAQQRQGV